MGCVRSWKGGSQLHRCYSPMHLRNFVDFGTIHESNYEKMRMKWDNDRHFYPDFFKIPVINCAKNQRNVSNPWECDIDGAPIDFWITDVEYDCSSDSFSEDCLHIPSLATEGMVADTVIMFLVRLAAKDWSSMPHKSEKHIPNFSKTVLYEEFCDQFSRIYPSERFASKSYFLATWKKNRPFIKVRKVPSFTKCLECERLRPAYFMQGLSERTRKCS